MAPRAGRIYEWVMTSRNSAVWLARMCNFWETR